MGKKKKPSEQFYCYSCQKYFFTENCIDKHFEKFYFHKNQRPKGQIHRCRTCRNVFGSDLELELHKIEKDHPEGSSNVIFLIIFVFIVVYSSSCSLNLLQYIFVWLLNTFASGDDVVSSVFQCFVYVIYLLYY